MHPSTFEDPDAQPAIFEGFRKFCLLQIRSLLLNWKRTLSYVLLIALGLYSLSVVHERTYVWQSTELKHSLYPTSSVFTYHQCYPDERVVIDKTTGTKDKSKLRIGMLMLFDCANCLTNEWQDDDVMLGILENHIQYAHRRGYIPIIANHLIDNDRPTAWSKLLAIQHYLPQYDYLLYFDMDTIVMDPSYHLESFIKYAGPCADILISEDWNGPNTGVFMIKNSPWSQWFVQHAYEVGKPLVPKTSPQGVSYPFEYEQRVFHLFLETDVWMRRNLPRYTTNAETIHEFRKHVTVFKQCAFNSYSLHPFDNRGLPGQVSEYQEGDFIIHFAGKKGNVKKELMRHYLGKAQAIFGSV